MKLEIIFTDSRERIKILWDLVGPEMKTERSNVLDKIRAELTEDQKKKFEELLKPQPRKGNQPGPGDGRRPPRDHRPGTNSRPAGPFRGPPTNAPAQSPPP